MTSLGWLIAETLGCRERMVTARGVQLVTVVVMTTCGTVTRWIGLILITREAQDYQMSAVQVTRVMQKKDKVQRTSRSGQQVRVIRQVLGLADSWRKW